MVVDGCRVSYLYFTKINQADYLFGGFFIIQSILFLIFEMFQDRFSFRFQNDKYGTFGIMLITFS